MKKTLDIIEVVGIYKHLNIREITDSGGYFRRVLTPDMDVSGEVQEIKDKAEAEWGNNVKSSWSTYKTEIEAQHNE